VVPFPHGKKRHNLDITSEGGGDEVQLKARWFFKICDRNSTHGGLSTLQQILQWPDCSLL
jgi:hypothetical protein